MDTHAMVETLINQGRFDKDQAEAIVKVMQGGVATKHDLELLEVRLGAKIDKLDNKVNLVLVGIGLAVLAPAAVRYLFGA